MPFLLLVCAPFGVIYFWSSVRPCPPISWYVLETEIFFSISASHSHINRHQKCGFFKNGPHSGDFWKCQLLVYVWKDENRGFWIRWSWCHTSLLLALHMLLCSVLSVFICTGQNKKEFKLHLHGKRQTSDSSLEFLKIENEQMKTAQNNSYR